MINPELKQYIESKILVLYKEFDESHGICHVNQVIKNSLEIAKSYPNLNTDMIYVAAAFHDIGMSNGREFHHIYSGLAVSEDNTLKKWFTVEQIGVIKRAVEDHRASGINIPDSIYGKILADADRDLEIDTILKRCYQFRCKCSNSEILEKIFEDSYLHCFEKYGYNGYLKLWLDDEYNHIRLENFRILINDKQAFKTRFFEVNK